MGTHLQPESVRKIKMITEDLSDQSLSPSKIDHLITQLDQELDKFAQSRLQEPYPYLVLDARYERVREDGVVRRRAILVVLGVSAEGRHNILAAELAGGESASSWKELLSALRQRSLTGVQFVVSDSHPGLRRAIHQVLPEAVWQRCYVHFLRNALDYLPPNADDDCLQQLRWIYHRRNVEEARHDLASWLRIWRARYPKLCAWVAENIEETFTFYTLPQQHQSNLKSTSLLEPFMEEIKRRTRVVRIFPNAAACLRLVRAVAVEMAGNRVEA